MSPTPWRPDPALQEAGIRHLQLDMAERGLSAKELARISGVGRSMVGYMLAGERVGSSATHKAIAEALGADPGLYFPRTEMELERAERGLIGFCS